MSEEHTCRICRGEASETQPLLHPCRCRGSIKYIHQDCLLEWLRHLNKSTKQCDICHTPYRFRTIYDPNMPDLVPAVLIWQKLVTVVAKYTVKVVSIVLYGICLVIQVPLFWKFVGRVYTYAVDGNLPAANPLFAAALLHGEMDFGVYALPKDPTKLLLFRMGKFFEYTYFLGLRYIIVFVIVHLVLFMEHEWVVHDESYNKLLLRQIGKEPRTKLADMIQQALEELRADGQNGNPDANADLQRIETMARALQDLQNGRGQPQFQEALRRAIRQDFIRQEGANGPEIGHNHEEMGPNHAHIPQNANNPILDGHLPVRNVNEVVDRHNMHQGAPFIPLNDDELDSSDDDTHNLNEEGGAPQNIPDVDNAIPRQAGAENVNHNFNANEDPNNEDNNDPIPDDNNANWAWNDDDEANGNIDFLELLGISLNLVAPIWLMLLCDVVIAVYLFNVYLVPHMLGNGLALVVGYLATGVAFSARKNAIMVLIAEYASNLLFENGLPRSTGYHLVDFSIALTLELVGKPTIQTLQAVFLGPPEPRPALLVERLVLLTMGYAIVTFVVYKFMKLLTSGTKPVMGTPRKIYKVLFEVASTVKVFVVFAIEIFVFSVYCGWLLDFCAAPLLLPNFAVTTDAGTTYMLLYTSSWELLQVPYLRVASYWALGTIYMLCFALFVGMARGNILRPGVLFFIRSPEDPNARLVHDALVKPFLLQFSRIYLSAKVYTGFILGGIGGVTWGLRWLVTPPKEVTYNVMLPIQMPNWTGLSFMLSGITLLLEYKQLITHYCREYWQWVFDILCHKLRLLHFILNQPIGQERGYTVYRNVWYQLLGNAYPDYSRPVTYRNAMQIFKEDPTVNACFVPDGSYVRAPDNDTISRRFIKNLFVPVTKDDQLLSQEQPETEEYDSEDSDDGISSENAYIIVYRPPYFHTRWVALVAILWLFAVLLIVLVLVVGLILGRPIYKACHMAALILSRSEAIFVAHEAFDWRLADVPSIYLGVILEVLLLSSVNKRLLNSQSAQNEGAGTAQGAQQHIPRHFVAVRQADAEVAAPADAFFRLNLVGERIRGLVDIKYVIFCFWWFVWVSSLHFSFIEEPLRHYYQVPRDQDTIQFLILPAALLIHMLVALWSIVPFWWYLARLQRRRITLQETASIEKLCVKDLIINWGIVHIPFGVMLIFRSISKTSREWFRDHETLIKAFLLTNFVVVRMFFSARQAWETMTNKVKNERYVRGRAIENNDADGDVE